MSGTDLLEFGQIYWNLDARKPRSALPIPYGETLTDTDLRAYMKVRGANEDYAELNLKERADRTPGYAKSAGAFYARAARLAGLVAKRLVGDEAGLVAGGQLRSVQTGRGTEWYVVWKADDPAAEKRPPTGRTAAIEAHKIDPDDAGLRQARQSRLAKGNAAEAAILSEALLSILRMRSEQSPGDHESELAGAYLEAGLDRVSAGQIKEALDRLSSAERLSQTLSDLNPDVPLHQLRLAITDAITGALYLQRGEMEDTEVRLGRAVVRSQSLTDEDASNEDMLAASLSVHGLFFLKTGQRNEALTSLNRALKIVQKLARQHPDDQTNQLQLASVLCSLGALHLQEDVGAAKQFLTRSISVVEAHAEAGHASRSSEMLLATDSLLLGSVYLLSHEFDSAEESLANAVSLARALGGQLAEEPILLLLVSAHLTLGNLYIGTDRAQDAVSSLVEAVRSARELVEANESQTAEASTMLSGGLWLLGTLYLGLEREEEAEGLLLEAVRVSRAVVASGEGRRTNPAPTAEAAMILPGALASLGNLYFGMEREEEAERSLVEAVDLLDQPPLGATARTLLAKALDDLVELYQGQGRVSEVRHTLARRGRLDRDCPEEANGT